MYYKAAFPRLWKTWKTDGTLENHGKFMELYKLNIMHGKLLECFVEYLKKKLNVNVVFDSKSSIDYLLAAPTSIR